MKTPATPVERYRFIRSIQLIGFFLFITSIASLCGWAVSSRFLIQTIGFGTQDSFGNFFNNLWWVTLHEGSGAFLLASIVQAVVGVVVVWKAHLVASMMLSRTIRVCFKYGYSIDGVRGDVCLECGEPHCGAG